MPQIRAMLDEERPTLTANLADGQAWYRITQATQVVRPYDSTPKGNEDESLGVAEELEKALDRDRLSTIEQYFLEIRRLSPATADRNIKQLVEAWRDRKKAIGFLTAFHFGARDPQTTKRVVNFLKSSHKEVDSLSQATVEEAGVDVEKMRLNIAEWEKEAGL